MQIQLLLQLQVVLLIYQNAEKVLEVMDVKILKLHVLHIFWQIIQQIKQHIAIL